MRRGLYSSHFTATPQVSPIVPTSIRYCARCLRIFLRSSTEVMGEAKRLAKKGCIGMPKLDWNTCGSPEASIRKISSRMGNRSELPLPHTLPHITQSVE